jgi:hypothetical protein
MLEHYSSRQCAWPRLFAEAEVSILHLIASFIQDSPAEMYQYDKYQNRQCSQDRFATEFRALPFHPATAEIYGFLKYDWFCDINQL